MNDQFTMNIVEFINMNTNQLDLDSNFYITTIEFNKFLKNLISGNKLTIAITQLLNQLNFDAEFSLEFTTNEINVNINSQIENLQSDYVYIKRNRKQYKDKEQNTKLLIIEFLFDNFLGKNPLKYYSKEIDENLRRQIELKRKYKNNVKASAINNNDLSSRNFSDLSFEEIQIIIYCLVLLGQEKISLNRSQISTPVQINHKFLGKDDEDYEQFCYNLQEFIIQKLSLNFKSKSLNKYKNPKLTDIFDQIESNWIYVIADTHVEQCQQLHDSLEFQIVSTCQNDVTNLIDSGKLSGILLQNITLFLIDAEQQDSNVGNQVEGKQPNQSNDIPIEDEVKHDQETSVKEDIVEQFLINNTINDLKNIGKYHINTIQNYEPEFKVRKSTLYKLIDVTKLGTKKKIFIDTFASFKGHLTQNIDLNHQSIDGQWNQEPNSLYGDEKFTFEQKRSSLNLKTNPDKIDLKSHLSGLWEGYFNHKDLKVEETIDIQIFKFEELRFEFIGQGINEQSKFNIRGFADRVQKDDLDVFDYELAFARVTEEELDTYAQQSQKLEFNSTLDDSINIKRKREELVIDE